MANFLATILRLYNRLVGRYNFKIDQLHPLGDTPLITNSGKIYWSLEFLKKECETCSSVTAFNITSCSKSCPWVFVKTNTDSCKEEVMVRCRHLSRKLESFYNEQEFDNHVEAAKERKNLYLMGKTVPVAVNFYDGWEDYYGHISEYNDVHGVKLPAKTNVYGPVILESPAVSSDFIMIDHLLDKKFKKPPISLRLPKSEIKIRLDEDETLPYYQWLDKKKK